MFASDESRDGERIPALAGIQAEPAGFSAPVLPPAVSTRHQVIRRLPRLGEVAAPPDVPWGLVTALVTAVAAIMALFLLAIPVFVPLEISDRYWVSHHPFANTLISPQIEVAGFGLVILFLAVRRYRIGPEALGLRLVPWRVTAIGIAGWVASFALAIVVAMLLNFLFPHFLRSNVQQTLGPVSHLPFWQAFLLLLAMAVEVPLIEETLFRGVVYAGLRHFLSSRLPYSWAVFGAVLGSAAIFAAAHFEPHTAPELFVMGIVLAYVYEYSGSVLVSATTHGLQNAFVTVGYAAIIFHH